MKYLYYLGVLLFTPIRKIIGIPMYFIAVPFRRYARSVVHNYALENRDKVFIPRLFEVPRTFNGKTYYTNDFKGSKGGWLKYRKVSKLEFTLVYWFLWGWIDDDSHCDTTSKVYLKEHIDGVRFRCMPIKYLEKCLEKCNGDAWCRGDAIEDNFCWFNSIKWSAIRNVGYNFKYNQFYTEDKNKLFSFTLFGRSFGWKEEYNYYTLIFFEKK